MVCALNDRHQEQILLGSGIGFQKKKGDQIDRNKIEKEFFLKSKNVSGKLYALLAQIPIEYMKVSEDIIEYAKDTLGIELNENIYLTLTDHISFAVERYAKGWNFNNALLWEIKKYYGAEFRVALKALEIIKMEFDVDLPEDEAGAIALHIVNAGLDTKMEDITRITQLIQKILNLVRYQYKICFNEDSIHYTRLVTHLKFFAYRLFCDNVLESDDVDFHNIIKSKYKDEYQFSLKIAELVKQEYKKELTEEELVYLTVHIKRVTMAEK